MDQIEVMKQEGIINLPVSTEFYKRIHDLLTYFSMLVPEEELAAQIEKIKNSEELTEFGAHFETLLILGHSLELRAKEQDLTEMMDVPPTK